MVKELLKEHDVEEKKDEEDDDEKTKTFQNLSILC
jgi:hypothetical protein